MKLCAHADCRLARADELLLTTFYREAVNVALDCSVICLRENEVDRRYHDCERRVLTEAALAE